METPFTDHVFKQKDGETAYEHQARKVSSMQQLELALAEIREMSANESEDPDVTLSKIYDVANYHTHLT